MFCWESWSLVKILKLKFDQELCKTLLYELKKLLWLEHSTLGSVVPLALFASMLLFAPNNTKTPSIMKRRLFVFIKPSAINSILFEWSASLFAALKTRSRCGWGEGNLAFPKYISHPLCRLQNIVPPAFANWVLEIWFDFLLAVIQLIIFNTMFSLCFYSLFKLEITYDSSEALFRRKYRCLLV